MDASPSAYIFSADLLYWTARETGTAFAIEGERVKNPSFKNHLGFKALAGLDLPHDGWQLAVQFTHFHARVTETLTGGPYLPTWTHPGLNGPTEAAEVFSRWRLHMGFLDLILSRCLPISDWLSITPIIGLRGTGVRFKARARYDEDGLSMKNKYWGVGPRFGFESEAAFTPRWAIYGRWALSTLWGEYYIHQDEEPAVGKLKYKDKYNGAVAVKEMALGLQWEHYFLRACACLKLRLGWEMHLLPNQNQWVQFPSAVMPAKTFGNLGSLTLQGLTLGFDLAF